MAANKKKNSGFDAPAIGERMPKGTKFVRNANGRITPVVPQKKKKK